MAIANIKVEVTGRTPLLMDSCTPATIAAAGNRVKSRRLDPRVEADQRVYRRKKDKRLYVPQRNLHACMVGGGRFHKLGKRQVSTATTSIWGGYVTLLTVECLLYVPNKNHQRRKYLTDFEVDAGVITTSSGGKQVVYRPRLDKWAFSFELEMDLDDGFPVDLARDVISSAGKKIGLGPQRAERKGMNGKFVITRWDVSEMEAHEAA